VVNYNRVTRICDLRKCPVNTDSGAVKLNKKAKVASSCHWYCIKARERGKGEEFVKSCYAVLCCAVLFCTVLRCAVLCCADMLCCVVLCWVCVPSLHDCL